MKITDVDEMTFPLSYYPGEGTDHPVHISFMAEPRRPYHYIHIIICYVNSYLEPIL